MEQIKQYIGRMKGIMRRLNVDYSTACRIANIADKLDSLTVKSEMYKPLKYFKDPLTYEKASENIAVKQIKIKIKD